MRHRAEHTSSLCINITYILCHSAILDLIPYWHYVPYSTRRTVPRCTVQNRTVLYCTELYRTGTHMLYRTESYRTGTHMLYRTEPYSTYRKYHTEWYSTEAYAINSIDGRTIALSRGSLGSYSQDYMIAMVTPRSGFTSIAPT